MNSMKSEGFEVTGTTSTIFVGGKIFRRGVGSIPGWGVRVVNDRIDTVLPDPVLRSEANKSTRIIELDGRLLSPGFIDAHIHPTVGGVEAGRCDLSGARSVDECFSTIQEYTETHPDHEWILGGGWSMDLFSGGTPTREQLDLLTGGRPASLANSDHHGYWVNSEALRRAGIGPDTPDPAGGRIERGIHGHPSGMLHEAAGDLVNRLQPEVTDDELYKGLLRGQSIALSYGITGWQDALVGVSSVGPDALPAYLRAIAEDTLRVRANLAQWWDRDLGFDQIDELVARRDRVLALDSDLRPSSVKLMVDGVAENFTAAVSSPYLNEHGDVTGNCGHSFIEPAVLAEAVTRLDALGFQAHFHALGDRAVTDALNAIAAARAANGSRGPLHHLAHLQMILIQDIPRFRQLGASANLQALWAQAEPQMLSLTLPFLEPSLRNRQYPFADLMAAGSHLSAGSDWPVSSPSPLAAMQVAVTRSYVAGNGKVLLPEQSLPLERIWSAYTHGSAQVNGRSDECGSIHAGSLADLVIIDGDPFEAPPNLISSFKVDETIIGGTTVYQKSAE